MLQIITDVSAVISLSMMYRINSILKYVVRIKRGEGGVANQYNM